MDQSPCSPRYLIQEKYALQNRNVLYVNAGGVTIKAY